MKALVYTGPEGLDYRDMPEPQPGPGEVLLRVERVGICGSDMHAYLGHDERRPAPLILGHEAAGVVVGGGGPGRRGRANPPATSGTWPACLRGRDYLCPDRQIISMPPREGAFAQLLAMPQRNLVTVPEGVALAKAALAEPIACGWHAVRLGLAALDVAPAEARALVLGGGAIGIGAALSLAAQGVTRIVLAEPNAARRAVIETHCDFDTVAEAEGTGFDLVLDGVGFAATRATASVLVRPGGVVMHVGLGEATGGLDIRRMTLQEVSFIGTYTYTMQDFRDTAQAIFDGRMGALDWTETRPLAEGAEAFADLRAGRSASPKIILAPQG